jgi:predicted amidophosphoribosyltransferase
MILSEKLLWFGLQSCLYCGSLDRGPDGLCSFCSKDLWSWQRGEGELFHHQIQKLQVEALFRWIPGKQEVLSKLLRSLKGRGTEKFWRYYAEEFLRRHWKEVPVQKRFLLVPAPSRGGEKDHAYYFVKALSEAGVGFELYNCLSRENANVSQKKRTRSQRQRTAMGWAENFTLKEFNTKSVGKHIIFVDDVVTTGSTARAAWRTLGKPRDFAVWALAQRGLSCGASRDLI